MKVLRISFSEWSVRDGSYISLSYEHQGTARKIAKRECEALRMERNVVK